MESYIGMRFSSYKEFEVFLDTYSKENYVQFWKSFSNTLKGSGKIKRASIANEKLLYYTLKVCCIFGGAKHILKRTTQKSGRNTTTFRQGCPVYFKLLLTSDARYLEIVSENLKHNHEVSKEIFERLPKQRKLPPEGIELIKKYVKLKLDKKSLRKELMIATGKKITYKDLSNILYRMKLRSPFNKGSLQNSEPANEIDSAVSSLQVSNDVEMNSNETKSEKSLDCIAENDANMIETTEMPFEKEDTSQVPVTDKPTILRVPGTLASSTLTKYPSSNPGQETLASKIQQPGPVLQSYYSLKAYPTVMNTGQPTLVYLTQPVIFPNITACQKTLQAPIISEKLQPLKSSLSQISVPAQQFWKQTSVTNGSLSSISDSSHTAELICNSKKNHSLQEKKEAEKSTMTNISMSSMKDSSTSTTEHSIINYRQDECDKYCQYLASEMRSIEDIEQRNILKVKIQLLIFKAHHGLLRLDDS